MRNAMRTVLLLSLALVLAVPMVAWAGGAPSDSGTAVVAAGPAAKPADPGSRSGSDVGGTVDADQVRARDQLRDGTCDVEPEAAEADLSENAAQTQTQTRTRTTEQAQLQTRTQLQDGSCETTAVGDGVPDRTQLRDRDQLKDGSCQTTGTLLAAAAYADDSASTMARTQERQTFVERVVEGVPEGVAAWLRTMLRMFGLAN